MVRKKPRKEPKIPEGKLSLADAAEYLGVSRHKVSRLVKKGTLKGNKFELDERVMLFNIEDLKNLLEEPSGGRNRVHYSKDGLS